MKAQNLALRRQAGYDGKASHNAVPTTANPPSGYDALLKRWHFEQNERGAAKPLGPFRADATALAPLYRPRTCVLPGWAARFRMVAAINSAKMRSALLVAKMLLKMAG